MVMGDINAVDICMGVHQNVLVRAGAYRPEWQVLNKRPFPRGDHAEAIVVDDRVVLAKVAAACPELPAAVQASLDGGAAALRRAGLGIHPAKSVRNSPHANPWVWS
jgi:hypothetical protein